MVSECKTGNISHYMHGYSNIQSIYLNSGVKINILREKVFSAWVGMKLDHSDKFYRYLNLFICVTAWPVRLEKSLRKMVSDTDMPIWDNVNVSNICSGCKK